MHNSITITGARQHNLNDVSVEIPIGKLTVVTGVSGSGKSTLAFDTLYAEGQRRYVESFSAYARQFLERMDRPDVEAVDGVLPAVAIDHRNHIRSARSTVGTVTEIADYLKVFYARAATLFCDGCGQEVTFDSPGLAAKKSVDKDYDQPILIGFPFNPERCGGPELAEAYLRGRGYFRVASADGQTIHRIDTNPDILETASDVIVIQDRIRPTQTNHSRLVEAFEQAMREGLGQAVVIKGQDLQLFSNRLHCADCDRSYSHAVPALFGYNTPVGACPPCNGFGRVIGLDIELCVPDPRRSLSQGAVRPWTTPRGRRNRYKMNTYCRTVGIPLDVPWEDLTTDARQRIIDGDPDHRWRGLQGWFKRLERKAYKMHVRVFLSRYRGYFPCEDCKGKRLRTETLRWRVSGLNLAEFNDLPIERALKHMQTVQLPPSIERALKTVYEEITSRLEYLVDLGLDYLSLSRSSRSLSGGEVQRVNLTTALGSRLVGTLYVLDEPSVGLHARDNDRLLNVLRKIRDLGNTVVVVEHDEEIIRGADHIIDMGPGPGTAGGNVVFSGPPSRITRSAQSVTGRYLKKTRDKTLAARSTQAHQGLCTVQNAHEHNLKNIDFSFPHGQLTCVTGVSGSGKSTLVVETLYRGLLRSRGEPTERPGLHNRIDGADDFDDIVLIDATPVSKSARSNAATYLKAWDPIRKLFAAEEESQHQGFSPSTFSFNVRGGRCDVCEGSGVERVEMQFLSDVFLQCEACGGTRFQPDVLSVTHQGLSINDVLMLTATDATDRFQHAPAVARALEPLIRVGLGYLRLGQPLNTLSVGEAQRLKLAAGFRDRKKSKKKASKHLLFILDEPTSGLHLHDVQLLIDNLKELCETGHTVVVVEHHLDVIRAGQHVVDLGLEGGERGGGIVVQGPPDTIAACPQSHTGRWLRAETKRRKSRPRPPKPRDHIAVRGARVHNLCNLDVTIPHGQRTVVTGPSGSGKSSLAFDVLFAEGQRRFIDCLSPYARQYLPQVARPELDELEGIPPTVAIEQRTTRWGRRTTVATVTEIYQFLRLLYARVGIQHCHRCQTAVQGLTPSELEQGIASQHAGKTITLTAPVVRRRKGWHKEVIARAAKLGHKTIRIDGSFRALDKSITLTRYQEHDIEYVFLSDVLIQKRAGGEQIETPLQHALREGRGTCYVLEASGKAPLYRYSLDLYCSSCQIGFDHPEPRLFSFHGTRSGACRTCDGAGIEETTENTPERPCVACEGGRLGPVARSVLISGLGIHQVAQKTPPQLKDWLDNLQWDKRAFLIAEPIVREIRERCDFLTRVGLNYLSLNRDGHTLSGGEAQRVRLAAQLAAQLSGVLYVLDEPTIGLHPHDNDRLLSALDSLQQRGNTVVIVEHDRATMESADLIIDMGPGGGTQGGRIMAIGNPTSIRNDPQSPTGQWLQHNQAPTLQPREEGPDFITLSNVRRHNIDGLQVRIPVGRLTVVTGVSGSGKSTLVR